MDRDFPFLVCDHDYETCTMPDCEESYSCSLESKSECFDCVYFDDDVSEGCDLPESDKPMFCPLDFNADDTDGLTSGEEHEDFDNTDSEEISFYIAELIHNMDK